MATIPDKLPRSIGDRFQINDNTLLREVKQNPKDSIQIEIGDSKQKDFKPQFKLMRWDNEVNFSVRAEEHTQSRVEYEGEAIKYITPDYEVHQYEKLEVGEDGGFEFEWVLPSKPPKNIFVASLLSKGVQFHYQPSLMDQKDEFTQIYGNEITVNETSVWDGAGKLLAHRPDNIVGSYAIYTSEPNRNVLGGNKYKAGKVAHIYRPQARDSAGNTVWCDLLVSADILTVTVPQNFLDDASYPVTVDPTFGYTSAGGTTTTGGGFSFASIGSYTYTATSGDTINSLSQYVSYYSGSGSFSTAIGLYTFSGGVPVTRVMSGTITSQSPAAWKTYTASLSLTGGTVYCVANGGRDGSSQAFYDSVANSTSYQGTSSLPTTWSQTGTLGRIYSQYATYTAGAVTETILAQPIFFD